MTGIKQIERIAGRLYKKRCDVENVEGELGMAVGQLLSQQPCSLRESARKMDFSVAYLSDIVNGRRKVSDAVVEALKKL